MDLKSVEHIGWKIGKQFVSLYALDMTNLSNLANDPSTLKRNLKRGFLWYVSNEAIEQAVNGHSNLNPSDFNLKVLIDDTVFNGIASFAIEQLNLYQPVKDVVQSIVPLDNQMVSTLTTAIIIEGVNMAGEHLSDSIVKNISSKLGL